MEVQRVQGGPWEKLTVPRDVRALVLLNIPSYAGGRNPWGEKKKSTRFEPQSVSDGKIEVVGLKSGLHTAAVLAKTPKMHGRRLAQVSAIRMALQEVAPRGRGSNGEVAFTHMQVDGEAWRQAVPRADSTDGPLMVEVRTDGGYQSIISRPR